MKKIMILGCGAQGSTVALKMDEEPNVSEIYCADHNMEAAKFLESRLKKGKAITVNAADKADIVRALKETGVDLVVCLIPLKFLLNAMEAAVEAGVSYQDFSATDVLFDGDFPKNIEYLYKEMGPKFKAAGRTAVIGTGSSPGLMCVVARNAMRYLDSCETIYMMVYEGVEAKRFLPYWWSPVTALGDMIDTAYAFIDGKIVETEPHSMPVRRIFRGMETFGAVQLIEHSHDEPIYIGMNSATHFKGVKNAYFKYGGSGVDFATPLYKAGLLSKKKETIGGVEIVPFDVILSHIPPAPKDEKELREIISEGLVSDTGAFVVEAYGKRKGMDVLVESYVSAPGLVDSVEMSGLSAEQFITGQSGSFFTSMLVNDQIKEPGLISSDMLTFEQCDKFLALAKKCHITLQTSLIEGVREGYRDIK